MLASLIGATGATAAARADTLFGGDPTQTPTPGLSCEDNFGADFGGTSSCMWSWVSSEGTDGIPFPESTGGSGTITSVTLPAMPDPGQMQAVVKTEYEYSPGGDLNPSPDIYCCDITAISPTFTVPANQITTVPLDLPVSGDPLANIDGPSPGARFEGMGLSVLTPGASLPLLYDANETLIGTGTAWRDSAYFPAPSQIDTTNLQQGTDPTGYQVLAQFDLSTGAAAPTPTPTPTPAPTPAPAPTPTPMAPAAPNGGLTLGTGPITTPNVGAPLDLGQATDPPTANTTQTMTVPFGGAVAATQKHKKTKHAPIVIGRGATTVPAGKTVTLTITLTSAARKALKKHHSLKATETIVAKNSAGVTQTTTRTVTIRLQKKTHKK